MVDEDKLSGGEGTAKRNWLQGIVGREHIIRNKGNAKTNACKIHQQVVAVQFDFRQQIQPMRGKRLMKVFAGRTFGGKHQNRMLKTVYSVHRACHSGEKQSGFPSKNILKIF